LTIPDFFTTTVTGACFNQAQIAAEPIESPCGPSYRGDFMGIFEIAAERKIFTTQGLSKQSAFVL
jgi:hypothetical protein